MANTSMQQASALTSLNGKPLIVLTADEGADDQWQWRQDRMATLSTNSLHRHANATHASLLDDEADAAVASKAIHDVVVAVRTSRPLAPALTAAWSWSRSSGRSVSSRRARLEYRVGDRNRYRPTTPLGQLRDLVMRSTTRLRLRRSSKRPGEPP